jgi:hypothetical protein
VKLYLLCSGIIAHIAQLFVDGIESAVNLNFYLLSLTIDRKRTGETEQSPLIATISENTISFDFSIFALKFEVYTFLRLECEEKTLKSLHH